MLERSFRSRKPQPQLALPAVLFLLASCTAPEGIDRSLATPVQTNDLSTSIAITTNSLGAMDIGNYGLGQGGLNSEVMINDPSYLLSSLTNTLKPKTIRFFIQEYYSIFDGTYHWSTLDAFVNAAASTGASLIASIAIKPAVLFPGNCARDQTCVTPSDWNAWRNVIIQLVNRYKNQIRYWEVGNEIDIGEMGGCPYYFQTTNAYDVYYAWTAQAIRAADPTAKVGGPALASLYSSRDGVTFVESLLSYCRQYGLPLDFISWHTYADGANVSGDVAWTKGMLSAYGFPQAETMISEWNFGLTGADGHPRNPDVGNVSYAVQPAFVVAMTRSFLQSGLSRAAYYHIVDYHVDINEFLPFMSDGGANAMANYWNNVQYPQYLGLWGDHDNTNVYPNLANPTRPAYYAFAWLKLLDGGTRVQVTGEGDVGAFASTKGAALSAIVYNYSGTAYDGVAVNLPSGTGSWVLQKLFTDPSDYYDRVQQVGSGSGTTVSISSVAPYAMYLLTATVSGEGASQTIFGSAMPQTPDAGPDGALQLGVSFQSSRSGRVSAIRFYRGYNSQAECGDYWVDLYGPSGNLLAYGHAPVGSTGWQQIDISPQSIAADQTYTAAYWVCNGHYAADQYGLGSPQYNGSSLTALGDGNGVFHYGSDSVMPTNSWHDTNYYVDVVFTPQ